MMLTTFMVILLVLICLFSLYLLAAENQFSKESRGMFASVVIASIVAETVCFFVK
jgi:hypothetical protein